MKVCSIHCHTIEIQKGLQETKRVEQCQATIEGNEVYIGATAQWKIKVRDINHIDVMNENDNEIYIESSKNTKYRFIPPHPQSNDENKKWKAFIYRLFLRYNKVNSNEEKGFTNFLQTSSKHQLGGAKHNSTHHATKALPSQRSVLTSHDNYHQQRTAPPPPQRQRGTFGHNKAVTTILPIHDRNDWVKDRLSTSVTTFVAPNVISGGSGKKKKRKLIHPMNENFSSDDEDHDQFDNEEEHAENEEAQTESLSDAAEPPIQDQSDDEDNPELGNNVAHVTDSSNVKQGEKAPYKRKNLKTKKRISKMNDKADESSDDDDIFESPNVTTPFVQRLVSPSTASTLLKRSSTSIKTSKKSLLDDMDDSTEEEVLIDKRQPSINTFFLPQARTKSVAPGTAGSASASAVKTPTRHKHHIERNAKTSVVTTIHQTKSKAGRMEEDSTSWLLTSPTRKLRSPQESRRIELFGHDGSTSSANRSKISTQNVLDHDPIEQYTSPPRLQVRSNAENHRSAFVERAASAYRPLDFGKVVRKRVVPTLLNRFANSDSTPRALVQHVSDIPIATVHDVNTVASITMSYYRKFRGLRNLGNTCYQNSSLQMLFSCRHLMTALQDCMNLWENDRSNGTITKSICIIGQELSRYHMPAVNSRMIKDAMDAVTDKYIGYEQRDAHEFISDLIDFVHDELQANESKEIVQNENQEKIDTVKNPLPTDEFCMSVQVCLKCCSCGYTRNKEEMYRHLSIDIIADDEVSNLHSKDNEVLTVSKATVRKSLEHFFQPETREIKCEKCTDGTHAEQTLRILSQPKLLLLHLKRFIVVERLICPATTEIDVENQPPNAPSSPTLLSTTPIADVPPQIEYVFKKNKAPVEVPMSLSLEAYYQHSSQSKDSQRLPLLSAAASMEPTKKYNLQSIVHHIGSTASSGHYTADAIREVNCKTQDETGTDIVQKDCDDANPEKIWVSFDDGITSETTIEKILSNQFKQSTAYMLLYASEDV